MNTVYGRLREAERDLSDMSREVGKLRNELAASQAEVARLEDVIYTNTNREMTLRDRFFKFCQDGFISDENFDFDAGLRVSGDFEDEAEKDKYAQMISCTLNDYSKVVEQLTAARAEAEAMKRDAEWQPIETAPKDKFLLLAGPSGYTTIETVFATGRMCSDYHVGRWIDHANDDLMDWGFKPTHWMPLPEAPQPEQVEVEPVAKLHCTDEGYVYARVIEGSLSRNGVDLTMPRDLFISPPPDHRDERIAALKSALDVAKTKIDEFLVANDPSEFGCACDLSVGHLCGPCFEDKQQQPLKAVLRTIEEAMKK